jgi:hypothetical protein
MNKRKLFRKILAGSSNVRFDDLVTVVEAFGFHLSRVNGSHHIFRACCKNNVTLFGASLTLRVCVPSTPTRSVSEVNSATDSNSSGHPGIGQLAEV